MSRILFDAFDATEAIGAAAGTSTAAAAILATIPTTGLATGTSTADANIVFYLATTGLATGTSTASAGITSGYALTTGIAMGYALCYATPYLPPSSYTTSALEIRPYTAPAPAKEYWLRERAVDVPFGPFSRQEADYRARKLTKLATHSDKGHRYLEMFRYVPTLKGPLLIPNYPEVVSYYYAGRKVERSSMPQYRAP